MDESSTAPLSPAGVQPDGQALARRRLLCYYPLVIILLSLDRFTIVPGNKKVVSFDCSTIIPTSGSYISSPPSVNVSCGRVCCRDRSGGAGPTDPTDPVHRHSRGVRHLSLIGPERMRSGPEGSAKRSRSMKRTRGPPCARGIVRGIDRGYWTAQAAQVAQAYWNFVRDGLLIGTARRMRRR